ncbi:hypothetical protein, partial [Acinetobacter baumannii]|uniref:hypothetical protein n=1 Tax=Acinetobacter baumannii TaxID=470 RepID=UPI001FF62C15
GTPHKFKKSNLWGAVQDGRGTPTGVLASFDQSVNLLPFCHHNLNVLAELPIKRSWLCTSIISWHSLP